MPTRRPRPTPTPVVLVGLGLALSDAGFDVDPSPYRSVTFNINSLAYELPGMDDVEVVNLTYTSHDGVPMTMDIYYPAGTSPGDQPPVVIFGMGYRLSRQRLRNANFYTSWGRLVAAAGMVGIVYDTEEPDQDIETLLAFIQENAADLRLDPEQIGLMSTSANVPTVMSYLMKEGRNGIQFGVYYYGLSLTPDHAYFDALISNCTTRGCLYAELSDVSYVDPDLPLFVVKAGQDFIPHLNEAMDHFIKYVEDAGADVTVIDYEDGVHGFDTEQKTDESAEIIAQTVEFMQANFE